MARLDAFIRAMRSAPVRLELKPIWAATAGTRIREAKVSPVANNKERELGAAGFLSAICLLLITYLGVWVIQMTVISVNRAFNIWTTDITYCFGKSFFIRLVQHPTGLESNHLTGAAFHTPRTGMKGSFCKSNGATRTSIGGTSRAAM
jgi:hypothetical protein